MDALINDGFFSGVCYAVIAVNRLKREEFKRGTINNGICDDLNEETSPCVLNTSTR